MSIKLLLRFNATVEIGSTGIFYFDLTGLNVEDLGIVDVMFIHSNEDKNLTVYMLIMIPIGDAGEFNPQQVNEVLGFRIVSVIDKDTSAKSIRDVMPIESVHSYNRDAIMSFMFMLDINHWGVNLADLFGIYPTCD